jgi:hypothetical protein
MFVPSLVAARRNRTFTLLELSSSTIESSPIFVPTWLMKPSKSSCASRVAREVLEGGGASFGFLIRSVGIKDWSFHARSRHSVWLPRRKDGSIDPQHIGPIDVGKQWRLTVTSDAQ